MKPQLTPFDDAGSKASLTRGWLLTLGNHRQKKKATHSLSPEHIVEAGDTKEGRKLFQ